MGKGKRLGEFEQVVLLSLARCKKEASGRDVYDELVEVTSRDAAVAAVYITLARLEKKGYVSSRSGEAHKQFRLLDAGAAALLDSREEFRRLWAGVTLSTESREG
jgi:DNA-binding PadR family transcriptional regulator